MVSIQEPQMVLRQQTPHRDREDVGQVWHLTVHEHAQ